MMKDAFSSMSRFASMEKLQTRLVVKHGPGVGMRRDVQNEVVHVSLQLESASGSSVIQSQSPFEPHCFHPSRREGLRLAIDRQPEIESLGFGGPAVCLRIPGIPFAQEH